MTPLTPDRVADAVAGTLGDVEPGADPLAEALHWLRMDGMFYCRSELTGPWGVDLPPLPDCLWFHVVTHGGCELTTVTGAHHQLAEGDVVVLPHGAGHSAVDVVGSPTPVVFDLPHHYISRQYAILRHGGGGARSDIICGVAQLGHPVARRLIALLPEVIHVRAAAQRREWDWLPGVLAMIAGELASTRPGGETIVTRLCDVLVIQAIRWWIETDPHAHTGWLGALRDPTVGRAVGLMHADPARNWSVTSLAAEVGLSRSGFSARFTEMVGQSPKQYLTTWRMRLAEDRLARERTPILQLANELGYGSEAAFSRAFKREIGVAPSHVPARPDVMALAEEFSA